MKSNLDQFRAVELEVYHSGEDDPEVVLEEFLDSLRECEDDIIGSEVIGDLIEFYDEDGVVLLLVTIDDKAERAIFEFTITEESFDIGMDDIPDQFALGEVEGSM